jgi:hypothetical protein
MVMTSDVEAEADMLMAGTPKVIFIINSLPLHSQLA